MDCAATDWQNRAEKMNISLFILLTLNGIAEVRQKSPEISVFCIKVNEPIVPTKIA